MKRLFLFTTERYR